MSNVQSTFLIKKGEESAITYEITLSDNVQAPVSQGQLLGNITYSLNGNKLASINLIAENSIEKISLFSIIKNVFNNWFNLLRS